MEKSYEANKLRLEANSDSMKNKSEQISKQNVVSALSNQNINQLLKGILNRYMKEFSIDVTNVFLNQVRNQT